MWSGAEHVACSAVRATAPGGPGRRRAACGARRPRRAGTGGAARRAPASVRRASPPPLRAAAESHSGSAPRARPAPRAMEHFIETVRKYPCLWNTTAIEYRDQELKDAAWAEVMKETDLSSGESPGRRGRAAAAPPVGAGAHAARRTHSHRDRLRASGRFMVFFELTTRYCLAKFCNTLPYPNYK